MKKYYVVMLRPISANEGVMTTGVKYNTEREAVVSAKRQNKVYPFNAHWVEERVKTVKYEVKYKHVRTGAEWAHDIYDSREEAIQQAISKNAEYPSNAHWVEEIEE